MNDGNGPRGVIPRQMVKRIEQPALLDCGQAQDGTQALSVVPLMSGDRVAGLEVRCRCGASVVVECVYEDPT